MPQNVLITGTGRPYALGFNLDLIAPAVNVGAVGPIRVLKAFLPLLRKSGPGAR